MATVVLFSSTAQNSKMVKCLRMWPLKSYYFSGEKASHPSVAVFIVVYSIDRVRESKRNWFLRNSRGEISIGEISS